MIILFVPLAAAQDYVLPALPTGGPGAALGLLLLALLAGVISTFLQRRRRRLAPSGWLPEVIGVVGVLARALAALAVLGAIATLMPEALLPALPWGLLAAAAAIGWSVHSFVPDLFAGLALRVSDRLGPGRWIQIGDHAGEIVAIGLFSTELRGASGRLVLPNRRLLDQTLFTPDDQRPIATVSVSVDLPTSPARRLLRELALGSPFIAPDAEPEISRSDSHPEHWIVRAAVLEPHHIAHFEGTFRERLEASLSQDRPQTTG
ncbi:MAG: small-conductance mechanosensitive channel [Myxococcota bacterium]|jgi:small-conductance mechanosensitive channel